MEKSLLRGYQGGYMNEIKHFIVTGGAGFIGLRLLSDEQRLIRC